MNRWLHCVVTTAKLFTPLLWTSLSKYSSPFQMSEGAALCHFHSEHHCRTTYVRALTLSMLNRAWYWGTTALRGSVKIRTSVSSSRLCRGTTTGRRPTNSGIIPNSIRSLASTSLSSLSFSSISATVSVSPLVLAKSAAAAARRPFPRLEGVPKPRYWRVMKQEDQVRGRYEDKQEFWLTICWKSLHTSCVKFTFSFFLLLMILSSPLKAPDATNRMFVVSTCTVSPLSFLEFFSGTLTIVPSKSLSNPWQTRRKNNNTSLG